MLIAFVLVLLIYYFDLYYHIMAIKAKIEHRYVCPFDDQRS